MQEYRGVSRTLVLVGHKRQGEMGHLPSVLPGQQHGAGAVASRIAARKQPEQREKQVVVYHPPIFRPQGSGTSQHCLVEILGFEAKARRTVHPMYCDTSFAIRVFRPLHSFLLSCFVI